MRFSHQISALLTRGCGTSIFTMGDLPRYGRYAPLCSLGLLWPNCTKAYILQHNCFEVSHMFSKNALKSKQILYQYCFEVNI